MAILLTTPVNPGTLDGGVYTHARIREMTTILPNKRVHIVVELGRYDDEEWKPSKMDTRQNFDALDCPARMSTPTEEHPSGEPIPGTEKTDFTDLTTSLPTSAQEKLYDGVGRVLYQWLLDKGHVVGTIEE